MTPLATLVAGSAASLLFSADTIALAGSTAPIAPTLVTLICDGASPSLCGMLRDALRARLPADVILSHTEVESDAGAQHCTVRFVPERQREDLLAGHLSWQHGNDAPIAGPTLEISVADSILRDDLLRRYVDELISHSALPF